MSEKDKGEYSGVQGGSAPPRTQSFHTFQILNSIVKNMKK